MILSDIVKVSISNRNYKHYIERGYQYCKCGDEIEVKVNDLPKGTSVKIQVLCDYCKKEVCNVIYRDYNKRIEKFGHYACSKCRYIHHKLVFSEKYGVDSPSKLEEVRKKMMETTKKNYGVYNASQSPIIREKVNATLCKNSAQKTSKQQLYLHNLYGGELNYPVKYYATDICFPEEKLVIEYDGGGHDLRVILGRLTQEEFNQKEIIRGKFLKNEGYKVVRIKSKKDILPSNDILLQMLSIAKEYFNSTYHSWINFDIDNSTIVNAENKNTDGTFFNYGELYKIK